MNEEDRNRTTVNLLGSHPFQKTYYCGYCSGKRESYGILQENLPNNLMGLRTNKIKLRDFEQLIDRGYCLSGNYGRLNDHC